MNKENRTPRLLCVVIQSAEPQSLAANLSHALGQLMRPRPRMSISPLHSIKLADNLPLAPFLTFQRDKNLAVYDLDHNIEEKRVALELVCCTW